MLRIADRVREPLACGKVGCVPLEVRRFSSRVISRGQVPWSKPGVERMWSIDDDQAA